MSHSLKMERPRFGMAAVLVEPAVVFIEGCYPLYLFNRIPHTVTPYARFFIYKVIEH